MKIIAPKDIFKIFFFLTSVQCTIVAFLIAVDGSKEGGEIFGLSTPRFFMVVLLLFAALLFLMLGRKWGEYSSAMMNFENLIIMNRKGIIFFTFWWFVSLTFLQFESYFSIVFSSLKSIDIHNLFLGVYPILFLGSLIFLEFCIALYLNFRSQFQNDEKENVTLFVWFIQALESLFSKGNNQTQKEVWKQVFQKLRTGIYIWVGLLIIWLGIATTKIGLNPDDRFWNIAGVPLLPQQIVFTCLFLLFLLDLQSVLKMGRYARPLEKLSKNRLFFYCIILGIWILTIVVWNSQDLRHTYFAPGPYPPNYERYPFSDAASFDVGSQYFLLGKGLNNKILTDRPFLMLFFAVLHLLGGQIYERIVFFQIIFLALIPVFLFILGSKLHSKTFGIGLAVLGIFKEKNAILLATDVSLANVKVLTSEMLMALLLIILTTFVIYWLDNKEKQTLWPIFSGSILGISIGVRVNPIFLIPVLLLVTCLAYQVKRMSRSKWVISSVLFLFSIIMVLTPYSLENIRTNGIPFWLTKITQAYDRSYGPKSTPTSIPKVDQQKLIAPNKVSGFTAELNNHGILDSLTLWKRGVDLPQNFITLGMRHFIHNEIMTLLIYPVGFQVQNIDEIVEKPFWNNKINWIGQLEVSEIVILGFNLMFISFGIGYSLRNWSISGMVPLIIHLGYNLTSGGGRTSGGRYIVPVDWVIHLYFLLGVISLVYAIRNWEVESHHDQVIFPSVKVTFLSIIFVSAGLYALGSTFSLSSLVQPNYPMTKNDETLAYLKNQTGLDFEKAEFSFDEVEKFNQVTSGFLESGVVLYPRYFFAGENMERSSYIPSMPDEESRLYFLFLTESGPRHINVVIADQWINQFPNAQFAVVVGCDRGEYVEGKIVLSLGDEMPNSVVSTNAELICD